MIDADRVKGRFLEVWVLSETKITTVGGDGEQTIVVDGYLQLASEKVCAGRAMKSDKEVEEQRPTQAGGASN